MEKSDDERGKYLHPEEHGMPETMGIDYKETRKFEEVMNAIEGEERKIEEMRNQVMIGEETE